MKTPELYNFLNLRKPISHISFFIFSLLVTVIMILTSKEEISPSYPVGLFLMLFFQLESFIFLGTILFADSNVSKSQGDNAAILSVGEITRIVVFRLFIFLLSCMLISMILFILLQYAGLLISGRSVENVFRDFIDTGFSHWFKSTIKGLLFGAIIFLILLWQSSLRREQKLREEKLIFQNETLKNQVNPHFLFNSLNTLSALVSSRPEVAEEFITSLSAIYRYILEYSSRDKVPLNTELAFIKDYFFLHKIRDDGKIKLEINIDETQNFEILPVSLQILIENAIKHNKATRENPLLISIYIENKYIIVKNNLQKMSFKLPTTQIGLRNLSQRINLISGKPLVIEETKDDFIVKIPLLL